MRIGQLKPMKNNMFEENSIHFGKRKKVLVIMVIIGVLLLCGCIFVVTYQVSQKVKNFEIELSDSLTEDIFDYVTGQEWSVKRSKLDVSGVDTDHVGVYEAYVHHGWQHFSYTVTVVDTTAPVFAEKKDKIYLKAGETYDVSFFYENVYDFTKDVSVKIVDHEKNSVCFEKTGLYNLSIVATDPSLNESELRVSFVVDTAPMIYNVSEYYVLEKDNIDLLNGVVAFDEVDGDVSASLTVEYGDFSWSSLGTQQVYFTATDSYGLTEKVPVTIHVCKEEEICDKIARREISKEDAVISKVPNYYEGGVAKLDSIEAQMEYMLPCVIHIDTDYHTDRIRYVYGSGFIIDMDDDYIYVCSNEHVMEYTDRGIAYFYDGSSAPYDVIDLNKGEDVAIGRINKSDVLPETLKNLFSIHISPKAYEDILTDHERTLFMEITTEKGLDYTKTGVSVEQSDDFYIVDEECLQVTVNMRAGNSGSAIIDEYGNLIGMCVGLRYDSGIGYRYYCIPLANLIDNYEKMTGNTLYRQVNEVF